MDRYGRSRRAALLALVTLAHGVAFACGSTPQRSARAPEVGERHLTLMSYNVNFALGGDASALHAITASNADVVLLQETTERWEQALRSELAGIYPHIKFRDCCRAGGLAVLSKHPVTEVRYIEPPAGGWFPAWLLELDSPLGRLQLLNVHLRPQISESGSILSGVLTTAPMREAEMNTYVKYLDPELPTIVAGDFNEGDGGRAIAVLEREGYRTGLGEFDPDADTWRWQTSVGTARRRIDHVVYSPRLVPLNVEVLDAGRSDHLPLVATFTLR